jgi:hypothetical protein
MEPSETMTKMGVPSIWKYVTGENRKVAELIVSQQVFGRPFWLRPASRHASLACCAQHSWRR